MKITANAGTLARVLALAASLDAGKRSPLPALEAVNIASGDGVVTLTRNVLDHQISLTVPATIEHAGILALPNAPLAALAHGFPAAADITIEADGAAAKVCSGRARCKLPVIPGEAMPDALMFAAGAAGIELGRDQALTLFAAGFCAAHDARVYLCGLHIADSDAGLVGVATNGYSLARRILSSVSGWDGGVIVPNVANRIINKLLADKSIERITLRHSKALLAVETPAAVLISRLIDGIFPDYVRTIPKPSGNVATMECDALVQALARIGAVGTRTVRLHWAAGEPGLHLTGNGDTEDLVDAETAGNGKVALAVNRLAALLDEFTGKTVALDSADPTTPIRITDGDDPGFLVVLAPAAGGAP